MNQINQFSHFRCNGPYKANTGFENFFFFNRKQRGRPPLWEILLKIKRVTYKGEKRERKTQFKIPQTLVTAQIMEKRKKE
jgi:hypothetical protein